MKITRGNKIPRTKHTIERLDPINFFFGAVTWLSIFKVGIPGRKCFILISAERSQFIC